MRRHGNVLGTTSTWCWWWSHMTNSSFPSNVLFCSPWSRNSHASKPDANGREKHKKKKKRTIEQTNEIKGKRNRKQKTKTRERNGRQILRARGKMDMIYIVYISYIYLVYRILRSIYIYVRSRGRYPEKRTRYLVKAGARCACLFFTLNRSFYSSRCQVPGRDKRIHAGRWSMCVCVLLAMCVCVFFRLDWIILSTRRHAAHPVSCRFFILERCHI